MLSRRWGSAVLPCMRVYSDIFPPAISPEALFRAWEEFSRGKKSRPDVQAFAWCLEERIFDLHRELASGSYRHGSYSAFTIADPKQRLIHKAAVRDRIVHHAVVAALTPIFEPAFIAHSFSCRTGKGTHRAVSALEMMLHKESVNHARVCYALKCDVHRFFASVDHEILLKFLARRIADPSLMHLLGTIIGSFGEGKGLPLGNLTSQIFANVYLHELDQWMKQDLRLRHYIRYTDDFVMVSHDAASLWSLVPLIEGFLASRLRLHLHPRKIILRKYGQGIDFLGIILRPHHRVLRASTRRRMIRRLLGKSAQCEAGRVSPESLQHSLQSYLGVLSHANALRLADTIRHLCWSALTCI